MQITFRDNSGGETFFELQRCTGLFCSNFATTATGNSTSVATAGSLYRYSDNNISAFVIYSYRVRACVTAAECTPWSNVQSRASVVG